MGENETLTLSPVVPASVWVLLPGPLYCKGSAAMYKALPALQPHPYCSLSC